MTSRYAETERRILGKSHAWSVNPDPTDADGVLCRIRIEIQGDGSSGFHLVMEPDGFFAADLWFATRAEALEEALLTFGVAKHAWSSEPSG